LIFSTRTATTSFENSRLVIKSTADFVLPLLLIGTVSTGFIVGIFTILLVLFISHKIAGPLYRLEKTCQSIASGNFREAVVLRRQDQLKGLAFAFNEMVLSLNNNIQNVKQHAQMLNYLLEETQNPKKIDEERKKLISALEVFKLK
jgi:nitrogen fixation/metabolism regulation signal transduction histidine kinase